MNLLKPSVIFCAICMVHSVNAQSFDDYKRERDKALATYKERRESDFEEYRARVNAAFAEFIRKPWAEYDVLPAEPVPARPEPSEPVVADPDAAPSNDPIPFDDIITVPEYVAPPDPLVDVPDPGRREHLSFPFVFYGTPCSVSLSAEHRFVLERIDENSVADAWTLLSSDRYYRIVSECLWWRDRLNLCDWGYLRFVECMTQAFFSPDEHDEACLMQMFVMAQSGYKVRMAQVNDGLALLINSMDPFYNRIYMVIDGTRYYSMDRSLDGSSYKALGGTVSSADRALSISGARIPSLDVSLSVPHTLTSGRYPDIKVDIATDRNLIAFYDDYPVTDWVAYARTSLSETLKKQLYPELRDKIAGKEKHEAADMLLNFVQTAFQYKTDDEQFGYERPFFADETFHYPYSDCEDRAILYSILVNDLLGLDAVLLHYPLHLATAVDFGYDIPGDYVMLHGRKYFVCDPTYINSSIGNAMPQFKGTDADVYVINRP